MVVVLCQNFYDAEVAFREWIAFLQIPPSEEISSIDKYSFRVKTSDGLIYIFIDYRFEKVFSQKDVTFIGVEEFLGLHGVDDPDPLRRQWKEIIK